MRVAPDITMVKGGAGANAWVLEAEDGVTLIDAGTPGTAPQILACLRALGREPESLSLILLTHGHPDHYGGATRLQQETGARVLAHPGDLVGGRLRYHWVPGLVPPRVDGLLADGQRFPVHGGLHVVHTPGHTPGSVSFHLPARDVLFTGDTLLANGRYFRRPLPFPHTRSADHRRSVQRLAELRFETASPGHGAPIQGEARQRLLEFVRLRYGDGGPPWWRVARHVPFVSRLGIGRAAAWWAAAESVEGPASDA